MRLAAVVNLSPELVYNIQILKSDKKMHQILGLFQKSFEHLYRLPLPPYQ